MTAIRGAAAAVTGAASGIGRALALELAARGCDLALADRDDAGLATLAAEINRAHQQKVTVHRVDVAEPGQIADFALAAVTAHPKLNIVINNAGVAHTDRVLELTEEEWRRVLGTNLDAALYWSQEAARRLTAAGSGGAILNVASTAAFQPLPGQAAYGAAKAFVLSYTQSLVGELKGSGVTATALCPGPVDTGFGARAGFTKEEAEKALPSIMWIDAERVARAAVEGMDKGRMVVIPGAANRAAAALAQVTPRSLLLPVLRTHPGLR